MSSIFILGDGNKIRERVEQHLLNHELDALQRFSQSLTDSINAIKALAISAMDARVFMAGGDDVLICVEKEKYQREIIQQMSEIFYSATSASISFGIGTTIETAYLNLRKAKASGNQKIIEEGTD